MKAKTEVYPVLKQWPWYVDDRRKQSGRNSEPPQQQQLEIQCTKGEEENNKTEVLDLELNINKKKKEDRVQYITKIQMQGWA